MKYVDNLIDEGSWVSLLFVATALGIVGFMMVARRQDLMIWGTRVAATTFVLFLTTRAFADGTPSTFDLVTAVFHGTIAAALVVGPAWIVFAGASFLCTQYQNFRNFHQQRISRCWSGSAKARDRAAREAVEQRRAINDRKRKNDARAKVLRAFHLLRNDLGDRFTDKEVTAYVESYLSDDQRPEDVEYHATKLIQLLKQLAEEVGGGGQSNAALNQRFEKQRAAILAAPVDDEVKDILLLELEEQYEEQIRNLIRRNRP